MLRSTRGENGTKLGALADIRVDEKVPGAGEKFMVLGLKEDDFEMGRGGDDILIGSRQVSLA